MLSRKAQIRNFLKTILSDGVTEIEEKSGMDWEAIKSLSQEARSLGYISCEFKARLYPKKNGSDSASFVA